MSARLSTSEKVVIEILDNGLGNSTWRETFPDAYNQLLKYRKDMEHNVRDILIRNHQWLIKDIESI